MKQALARTALLAAMSVAVIGLSAEPAAAQCAMCQAVVTNSREAQAMGASLNQAILLLLFAPYLVVASFALVVLRGRLGAAARRILARFAAPPP